MTLLGIVNRETGGSVCRGGEGARGDHAGQADEGEGGEGLRQESTNITEGYRGEREGSIRQEKAAFAAFCRVNVL